MGTELERLGVVREAEHQGQGGAYLARDREDGTKGRTSDRCKWATNEAVAQSTAGFTSRPVVRLLAGAGQGPGGDTGSGSAAAGCCLAAIEFTRLSQDSGLLCWMQCRWVFSGLGAGWSRVQQVRIDSAQCLSSFGGPESHSGVPPHNDDLSCASCSPPPRASMKYFH